ncbi:SDR family NAD(P)-dependent oxidoreductase [Bacillus aquiflavi]|uniref:SDR family NAD(P)-dependent oxidoreductase n=1 Tax=Bacillus aquiflavi TaxID=2672567 RepID=UPI00223AABAD|nr:SDR family NAD(P)-dependent oxidoreductase [Bacillus aquiflavi]
MKEVIIIHISELARKTGVSLRSLRYYEEKQLLKPNRLDNGYRQYSEIDIEQIRMIQFYLSMGLKTNEIADLFHCSWDENKEACIQNGIRKGELKLTEIREQFENLRKAESQLMDIVKNLKNKSNTEIGKMINLVNKQDHKVAIVTGGNRGIGREISRQLASQGSHVLIGCRDAEKGEKVVMDFRSNGLMADLQVIDVNDSGNIEEIINQIANKYGRLDVLVNNAGIILDRGVSVLEVEELVVKETFETNFFGALRITQAVVPIMKQQNYGRIVNLSSGLGAFRNYVRSRIYSKPYPSTSIRGIFARLSNHQNYA